MSSPGCRVFNSTHDYSQYMTSPRATTFSVRFVCPHTAVHVPLCSVSICALRVHMTAAAMHATLARELHPICVGGDTVAELSGVCVCM